MPASIQVLCFIDSINVARRPISVSVDCVTFCARSLQFIDNKDGQYNVPHDRESINRLNRRENMTTRMIHFGNELSLDVLKCVTVNTKMSLASL